MLRVGGGLPPLSKCMSLSVPQVCVSPNVGSIAPRCGKLMTAIPAPPSGNAAAVGATSGTTPDPYGAFKQLRVKYQFEYRRPYPLANNADFDKFEKVSAVGDDILNCSHFDTIEPELTYKRTTIPDDWDIDWDLFHENPNSMYLPLKTPSAVGDAKPPAAGDAKPPAVGDASFGAACISHQLADLVCLVRGGAHRRRTEPGVVGNAHRPHVSSPRLKRWPCSPGLDRERWKEGRQGRQRTAPGARRQGTKCMPPLALEGRPIEGRPLALRLLN